MGQEFKNYQISENIKNSKKQPALIPFIVAGYPSIETTKKLLYKFQEKEVAAIELGIPFSDPLADGPVIQLAAKEAIDKHTNINSIFSLLKEIKDDFKTPIILFTYFNPVLHYGVEKFIEKAKECNVSGLIIPDLPYEEATELNQLASNTGIDHIMLVAPTSDKQRIENIAKMSSGFIYLVSSTGVTGVREGFSEVLSDIITEIKTVTKTPIAVGFGVSKPEHIKNLSDLDVDGAIIGSAIVKLMHQYKEDENTLLNKISEYIDELYSNND